MVGRAGDAEEMQSSEKTAEFAVALVGKLSEAGDGSAAETCAFIMVVSIKHAPVHMTLYDGKSFFKDQSRLNLRGYVSFWKFWCDHLSKDH